MIRKSFDAVDAAYWIGIAIGAICATALVLSMPAWAKNADGKYDNSPNKEWFESQHNSIGQWCCNQADGHQFDGEYTLNHDGSVSLIDDGSPYTIESYKVLKGPNPTGKPVWWYVQGNQGKMTFCFIPGALT